MCKCTQKVLRAKAHAANISDFEGREVLIAAIRVREIINLAKFVRPITEFNYEPIFSRYFHHMYIYRASCAILLVSDNEGTVKCALNVGGDTYGWIHKTGTSMASSGSIYVLEVLAGDTRLTRKIAVR